MMGCRIRTNRVAKWPFVFCLPLSFFEFVRSKELSLLPNSQSTMMTDSTTSLLTSFDPSKMWLGRICLPHSRKWVDSEWSFISVRFCLP